MGYNVNRLCDAVAKTLNASSKIQQGKISGTAVVVNGRSYPAEYSAEINGIYEGKWVRVMVTGNTAVVIGE
jgi:hypothetical protein